MNLYQSRDEHFTRLLKIANDHYNWMAQFGYQTEAHWEGRQCEYLHQLMHHGNHVPEY